MPQASVAEVKARAVASLRNEESNDDAEHSETDRPVDPPSNASALAPLVVGRHLSIQLRPGNLIARRNSTLCHEAFVDEGDF